MRTNIIDLSTQRLLRHPDAIHCGFHPLGFSVAVVLHHAGIDPIVEGAMLAAIAHDTHRSFGAFHQ